MIIYLLYEVVFAIFIMAAQVAAGWYVYGLWPNWAALVAFLIIGASIGGMKVATARFLLEKL